MNRKLAKVSTAHLEIQERGILNFWIFVDYEGGGGQGIGGIAMDEWNEEKKSRVGTAYGCEMIRRLLLLFNVNDFSEMAGAHIWVYGEGDGFGFKPTGIARLGFKDDGEPLIFADIANEFIDTENQA